MSMIKHWKTDLMGMSQFENFSVHSHIYSAAFLCDISVPFLSEKKEINYFSSLIKSKNNKIQSLFNACSFVIF